MFNQLKNTQIFVNKLIASLSALFLSHLLLIIGVFNVQPHLMFKQMTTFCKQHLKSHLKKKELKSYRVHWDIMNIEVFAHSCNIFLIVVIPSTLMMSQCSLLWQWSGSR